MFTSDRSGFAGFATGVVVLISAGVVLSMVATKRLSFSSGVAASEEEIARNSEHLSTLRSEVARRAEIRDRDYLPLAAQEEEITLLTPLVASQKAREQELRKLSAATAGEIAALKEKSLAYREKYRSQMRRAAAGEKIARLVTRSGKVLENATVTEVTREGISLRHEAGLTRLRPADLGQEWTERFQWNAEEENAH